MRTQTTDNQQWPYDDVTDTNVHVQLPRGRGRHPDAPRHHRNTPSYVISNVKMTFTCEACNRTFDTRRQHDKHQKLNHLGQQHRCFHCHSNFRTVKDRIAHAITVHPNAQAKSYPPEIYPPGDLWAPLKHNQIDVQPGFEPRPKQI